MRTIAALSVVLLLSIAPFASADRDGWGYCVDIDSSATPPVWVNPAECRIPPGENPFAVEAWTGSPLTGGLHVP